MTNAVSILNAPNATNELHSITVTCTIHLDSTADQCVVMAIIADGNLKVNTTSNYIIIMYSCIAIQIKFFSMYVMHS